MEYTKELKQKMKSIEAIIQMKVDVNELQELQKKVEENENKIKELMENSNEVKTWADIMDMSKERTVEEVIAKSLKERDNEENEKAEQKKKHNCIWTAWIKGVWTWRQERIGYQEVCRILQRHNQD